MQLKLHSREGYLFQLYQLHNGYYQELMRLGECFGLDGDEELYFFKYLKKYTIYLKIYILYTQIIYSAFIKFIN